MSQIRIDGLAKLQRQFSSLKRRAESVNGQHDVPLRELLTPVFLISCSRFVSADDMFAASGFDVKTNDDFAAIPDDEWDQFVNANTSFNKWEDMLQAAATDWTVSRLGL